MRKIAAMIFFTLFFWGCSDAPVSPEEQLRQLINEAESYIQARDLSATMAFIHPDYQDQSGYDLQRLRAMLAGYFLRHKSIYLLTKIENINLMGDDEAEVVMFAGMAGSPQEQSSTLGAWRGDLIRLDLKFIRQDDEWLLNQAEWRRAGPEDILTPAL